MVVLSRAFLHEYFRFFTFLSSHTTRTLSTSRTSPSQAPSVYKLRHRESLRREDLHIGGNPRTTTPTLQDGTFFLRNPSRGQKCQDSTQDECIVRVHAVVGD